MSSKIGSNLCRVCFANEENGKLTSIDGKVDGRKIFEDVTGVEVKTSKKVWWSWSCKFFFCQLKDNDKLMICDGCFSKLQQVYQLRDNIKQVEEFYFEAQREQYEEFLLMEIKVEKDDGSDSSQNLERQGSNGRKKSKAKTNEDSKCFKCSVCGKAFKQKWNMKQHIKVVHEKIRNFFCDLCPAAEYHKQALELHMILRHVKMSYEELPFKCNLNHCSKRFKTAFCLKSHQNTHRSKF